MCCIDRLNPQPKAAIGPYGKYLVIQIDLEIKALGLCQLRVP